MNRFAQLGAIWCFLALGGCSTLSKQEIAWQTLHAVDVAQTLSIAKDPCYRESNPVTSALIGEQPSEGEVIAWGIGTSLLHAGVSRLLEHRDAPRWIQGGWQAITLTTTAATIAHNHNEGIRAFGSNKNRTGTLRNPERFPGCDWR